MNEHSRMRKCTGILAVIVAIIADSFLPVSADHLAPYTAPTGLNATAAQDSVLLVWESYPSANYPAGCTQAREIHIFRENNGSGIFNQIFSANSTATSYTDEGLAAGTYVYKIRAKCNVPAVPMVSPADPNNVSAFSTTATAVVNSAPPCAGPSVVDASASPLLLWPPNGKLVAVSVTGTVTEQANCTAPGSISYRIVDEYGEYTTVTPVVVPLNGSTFNFQVSLEASRRGDDLNGRLYQILLDTADGGGFDIHVEVPHDQRKR